MNRLLLVFAAVSAGAVGFCALHRVAEQTRTTTVLTAKDWMARTNRLVETEEAATALRGVVLDKENRLREATGHPGLSPELFLLLEGENFKGSPLAWAELRQQLGLGWDASSDYVLVSKRVLKQLDYTRFLSADRMADTASELLGISPTEKTALQSVLQRTSDKWQGLAVERTEPNGDILAQYTVRPPDPAFEQNLSNNFTADLAVAVGQERAELLLPQAWREFRSELGPTEVETLTVRRSVVDGDADLVYEMKRGAQTWTDPVRYAHYPSSWFLALFPGGWKTLAQREGFELPPSFQK